MNELEVRAKDAVVDALQEMAFHEVNGEGLAYGAGWQLVGEADYLVTYKQPDASNTSITVARTFGRVRADIDDVLGFFYADTNDDFAKVCQLLYPKVQDARVLSTLKTRGPTNPYSFLGVKYVCAPPAPGMPMRDQVFLEYMGFAQDSKGRAVGFYATIPLDDRDAPDLGATIRVPRIKVANVLLVRPLEQHPGHCAVFTNGSFDLRESSTNMNIVLRKYMESLRDVTVLMDSKRISSEEFLEKHNWVPDSMRKSCYVCTRGFGATRHRHHCRLCGEVVCKKCLVTREVMAPLPGGVRGMTKLKVCMFCVQKTRAKGTGSDKGSFGVPSFDDSRSPMNHTVTSSVDRESCMTDSSSVISFDIGFDIRSPSCRYSQMSVASTIFEREEAAPQSFKADLYIDTRDMAPTSAGRYTPQYQTQFLPPRSANGSSYSPSSSRSSQSSNSSNNSQFYMPRRTGVPPPPPPPYAAPSPYGAPPPYAVSPAYPVGTRSRQGSYLSDSEEFKFNDIDQSLAEQQEILRRLAIASNAYSRPANAPPRIEQRYR